MTLTRRGTYVTPMQRRAVVVLPYDETWCPLGGLLRTAALPTTGNYTTADTAVGFWVTAPYDCTVYKLGWLNGTSAGGNHDVAIYDSNGTTRLVSSGSTAASGNGALQFVDVADTTLTAGKDYFIASNHSATTANQIAGPGVGTMTLGLLTLTGCKEQAVGATALPDPFVPAAPTAARLVPFVLLTLNAAVA